MTGLALSSSGFARAEDKQQVIGPFGGLNTTDSPSIIDATQAQDLLNVNITPGGKSVKKREGLGLDATLTYSTSAVHGAYKFFDSSGNEIRLWGQDAGLYSSVSGANYVRIATGTVGATWQCTDYLGFAYCVTSARDTPVKTAGTTATTTISATIPVGTIVASVADRLLVSGVAAQPQRIYYSGSANFSDFTLGAQPSSSSYEDIASPGSAITHLAYYYGRWLWWKDASFGIILGTDQTNLQIITVSPTIGTFDNSDAYDSGLTYFRGNDSHFYQYDGNFLTRISRDITPTVTSAGRRKTNSWAQTSQSDFQSGVSSPTPNLSFTISPGDVVPSSFSTTENSNTQWNSGTASANLTIGTSSITLKTNNLGNITDNGFESGNSTTHVMGSNWTAASFPAMVVYGTCGGTCTITPRTGSNMAGYCAGGPTSASVDVVDAVTSTQLYSVSVSVNASSCGWTLNTISVSNTDIGKRVKIRLRDGFGGTQTTQDSYILGGSITFYSASQIFSTSNSLMFDDITLGSSTITTGNFTSQVYNTGVASTTYSLSDARWTTSGSTPTFDLQTSTSAIGPFRTLVTSSGTNAIGNQYARYTSTITITGSDNNLPSLSTFTIIARSSGTYYSAVNNAIALTAWSNLGLTDSTNGNSTLTYWVRASTGQFTVGSSTPAWAPISKNQVPTYSTGTYMQLRADFKITAATETPTLSDFAFNWFEGNAADKMYASYYDHAIWFAVALGTTTTNNRILRWDLLNRIWTLYDIPSNGFLTYSTNLYIGDAAQGLLYKYGGFTSDNGTAINSYWKSKDFFGDTPFSDEEIRTLSWYCKASTGTTLSVSYTANEITTNSYTFSLTDSKANIIRNNRNLPAGFMTNVLNVKLGDNSSNTGWECFAGAYTYFPRPWSVYP